MTALELLDLLESTPEDPWSDKEMDRLSGIATPGDVDPTLARQFVYGRLLLEAAGVDFSESGTRRKHAGHGRNDAGRTSTRRNATTSRGSQS